MAACEEARHLLAAAKKDFRALQGMADSHVFADEVFGFHAQQTAEKALKAWLSSLDVQYPRTHDLTQLLMLLEAHAQHVGPFQDLVELNPYAVQYRYEAFDEMGSPIDRSAVLDQVRALMNLVCSLI